MNYLVEGANFHNKGAELMLLAIQQELSEWHRDNTVSMELRVGSVQQRNNAHVKHLIQYESAKFPWVEPSLNAFCRTLPKPIRKQLNVVLQSEIDVVLDASGFCFSDQWGVKPTQLKRQLFEKWKKRGKKIVLLPQAFGPFTTPDIQQEFKQVLELSDLVFARDKESLEHVQKIAGSSHNIKLAPDFTNLLKPKIPTYANKLSGRPCIIPNTRMLDKTGATVKENYLNLLSFCIKSLQDKGMEPFILVHETFDIKIAKTLQEFVSGDIEIVQEEDSLYLKGILGGCSLVIGSRFHGLISSLSQGIPCLGTGWSHKYQMLFDEYSCANFLIDFNDEIARILEKLEILLEGPQREKVVKCIKASAENQKILSTEMWIALKNVAYA
ncbi:polysaccharide pyruvyl transferase family protein [Leptothoe sp. ISB3NOV94-8A]